MADAVSLCYTIGMSVAERDPQTTYRGDVLPVSWRRSSHDKSVAHAAIWGTSRLDVCNGGFPLACGVWAPDSRDAEIREATTVTCKSCLKIITRGEESAQ